MRLALGFCGTGGRRACCEDSRGQGEEDKEEYYEGLSSGHVARSNMLGYAGGDGQL